MAKSEGQAEHLDPAAPRFGDAMTMVWRPRGLAAVMVVGEAFALVLALPPGRAGDPLVYFGLASFLVQWTLIGSLAVAYTLRQPLSRLPLRRAIWALPTILVLVAGGVGWAAVTLLSIGGTHEALGAHVLPFMGVALVSGLVGIALLITLMDLQEQRSRAERAEYEALKARVRPHFLFNTLNTAISLLQGAPTQAEHVLLSLSDLFRASLSQAQEWDLVDEVALTQAYLDIESLRLGDRLQVEWQGDTDHHVAVPKLLLQSLVENAIQHGIEPLQTGGKILISAHHDARSLMLRVSNPITTNPDNKTTHRGHRIGLSSARQQLLRLTPEPGELHTGQHAGHFVATARIPIQAHPTTR
jgi:two-component system sensor histidine kinase AlgZ